MITLAILLAIILLDVTINWYLIEKKKIRPNHYINWTVRAILGSLLAKYGPSEADVHWTLKALSYVPIYSFFFNLGLNVFRGKYFDYLGDAKTDKAESNILPPWPIFAFTAILAAICILLVLFDYNPNPW